MLARAKKDTSEIARNLKRERNSWHDADQNTVSLGCSICPDRIMCGGLKVFNSVFSCLDYCCGVPASCGDKFVCPNNSHFADRVREIGGFDLRLTPRGRDLNMPKVPPVI